MSPTSASANVARPASLWRRFAGVLYDLLPLIGLWMVAAGMWTWAFHRGYDPQHPSIVMRVALDAWLLVVTAAYFVVSWVKVGQTIGMRAWKVKLVSTEGARINTRVAVMRFVLALVSLAIVGCGFWYALFDPGKRTWHDKLCGTRMVRL